jgi:type 1 glutamine amidotransferase/HEAT repeat protein
MNRNAVMISIVLLASLSAIAQDAPTIEGLTAQIAQLKTYEPGQSQLLLNDLQRTTVEFARDPAARVKVAEALATLLQDEKATPAARHFACRQLQSVGTEAQIPLLNGLLKDAELGDLARGALECIPGDTALKALRDAVGTLNGAARIGAINSLGLRRDGNAVALLAGLLSENDAATLQATWTALGRIATPQAGEALLKAKASAPALTVLHDAQLRCATRLADAGNAAPAAQIYRAVWSSDRPVVWRLSALAGLVRVEGEQATPIVLEALDSNDPLSQALAMRLARQLPGAQMTAALLQRLAKFDANGQVLLLDVLSERGDKSAAEAVRKLAEGSEDAVRAAVFRALIRLGDANSVAWLTQRAAVEKGAVQQAAREALAKLSAEGVDDKLIELAAQGEAGPRIEAIRALANRKTTKAAGLVLKQSETADDGIRAAAFQALALLATPEHYTALLERVKALAAADSSAAEAALLATAARLPNATDRTTPVLAALKDAAPPVQVALLRILGSLGGADSIVAIREHLNHADVTVKDAAVRALAGATDPSVVPDLLTLAQKAESQVHRVLALRGYLRLAAATEDGAKRLKMLEELRPIATTADLKKMLLGGLSDVPDAGALQMVVSFLDDADVKTEAGMAVLKIGGALVRKDRAAVTAAATALMEKSQDASVKERAQELLAQAERGGGKAGRSGPKPDNKRSAEVKTEKAKQAPQGFKLVSYVDCGPETADGAKDGPSLRLASGESYTWDDAANIAPDRFGSVAYAGEQVVFDATGLNPKKQYRLGFSWWDFDHDDRAGSVWAATGQGQRETKVLDKTALPSHSARNEKPAEKTVDLPRELHANGRLRISFRNEGGANAVVSEVWLWESEAEGTAPSNTQAAAPVQETPAVAVAAPPTNPNAEARVLILTGNEYPGHKWKETAPALLELLRKDTRLDVQVIEDPNFLASPDLKKFNVIVLNYMNWKTPDPGEAARKNLKEAVEGGTGLVLVHFACGAFQEWPEFVKIAGRAWNPTFRGHDPFGTFKVDIAKADHPIMKGLEAFETTDELYTCLDGETPIEILAKATSKVDKKDYPMVFVLNYGKGRIVHNVLGHDVKAIVNPPVAELYRRGTAWAAGLK